MTFDAPPNPLIWIGLKVECLNADSGMVQIVSFTN
jgi:hypothetical protein